VQKVFPYDPTLSHNTSVTDGRTDDWQTDRETDDNRAIDAYCIAVARQKLDKSINRYEGSYQLPHIYDDLVAVATSSGERKLFQTSKISSK